MILVADASALIALQIGTGQVMRCRMPIYCGTLGMLLLCCELLGEQCESI